MKVKQYIEMLQSVSPDAELFLDKSTSEHNDHERITDASVEVVTKISYFSSAKLNDVILTIIAV